jgi:hypothetical protein
MAAAPPAYGPMIFAKLPLMPNLQIRISIRGTLNVYGMPAPQAR